MLEPLEVEIRTLHAILGSERDPDGRAFAPLADAYRRAGQPRKAFALLTDGLSRLPDFASGHVVAACLYAEQGLWEEGALAARRALELDSENVRALAVLVRVLDATGQTEEAAEAFATLEALEPEILDEEALRRPEAVLDVGALAPEEESAIDVAELAPEVSEPVADVASLAPDVDDEVLDVGALAPEEEPAIEVAELAPEVSEPVADVASLAPDMDDEVLDVGALAPEEEPAIDVAALLPETEEPVLDQGVSSPGEAESTLAASEPREDSASRIFTRTLGELYAKQGFLERAVDVFRQLQVEHPEDQGIAERLEELEKQLDSSGADQVSADAERRSDQADRARARDEELEALARDLAGHRERQPEIDTPFAWTDSEESDDEDAARVEESDASIRTYFDELLNYRRRGGHS